ncbi:MAG TPA: hypothetical protein VMB52_03760 [Verrucomicrobiae bacterium]|nr:hypothetical protein [Verrucomicrobiae bacterium]
MRLRSALTASAATVLAVGLGAAAPEAPGAAHAPSSISSEGPQRLPDDLSAAGKAVLAAMKYGEDHSGTTRINDALGPHTVNVLFTTASGLAEDAFAHGTDNSTPDAANLDAFGITTSLGPSEYSDSSMLSAQNFGSDTGTSDWGVEDTTWDLVSPDGDTDWYVTSLRGGDGEMCSGQVYVPVYSHHAYTVPCGEKLTGAEATAAEADVVEQLAAAAVSAAEPPAPAWDVAV